MKREFIPVPEYKGVCPMCSSDEVDELAYEIVVFDDDDGKFKIPMICKDCKAGWDEYLTATGCGNILMPGEEGYDEQYECYMDNEPTPAPTAAPTLFIDLTDPSLEITRMEVVKIVDRCRHEFKPHYDVAMDKSTHEVCTKCGQERPL